MAKMMPDIIQNACITNHKHVETLERQNYRQDAEKQANQQS